MGSQGKIQENKARKRAADLWDHYHQTGQLSLADFARITGGQYSHVKSTFKRYDLKIPPVYNSRQEIYKRKAKALWDAAKECGNEYLTIKEAAKALEVRPSDVVSTEMRLQKAGLDLPKIINDRQSPNNLSVDRDSNKPGRSNGSCNPLYYPSGLQVLTTRPGPGPNQITYILR